MYRYEAGGRTLWTVDVELGNRTSTPTAGFIHHGLTYTRARAELAAWRATRVRELMGAAPELKEPGLGCPKCGKALSDHCKIHPFPCCPGKCPGASKIPGLGRRSRGRGDSTPRSEKGGTSR